MYLTVKSLAATGCCLLLALLPGCGGGADPGDAVARANSTNIQRVANLYLSYQSEHDWHGPADEAALKNHIQNFDPQKLARIGVDPQKIDALLTSERDGQPFKIRYGVRGSAMGSTEPVVFESEGEDGRREVAFLNMTQREVDQAEYDALWSGTSKSAEPVRQY